MCYFGDGVETAIKAMSKILKDVKLPDLKLEEDSHADHTAQKAAVVKPTTDDTPSNENAIQETPVIKKEQGEWGKVWGKVWEWGMGIEGKGMGMHGNE